MKRLGLVLSGTLATAGFAHAASLGPNPHATPGLRGAVVPLGGSAIAQMTDNAPVSLGGVSCSDVNAGTTSDTSWWRRFYLGEHDAPSSVTIESVTVGAETGSTPVTIRLYTMPHSVPADTLPVDQLSLIGASALTTVNGNLDTTTIPVTGTVADAIGHDLVVEFHTDGNPSSAFYAGGNASAQTHEAFLSSTECGFPVPTPMSGVNFPDAHMILVANAATPAIGLAKAFAPSLVASSTPSTLTITLANPFATPAALLSDLTDSFPNGLVVAATPNASTTCGGSVNALAGSTSVSLSAAGSTIPANSHCALTVDVSSTGGVHDNVIAVGGLHTDQGDNAFAASARLTVIPPGGNGILHSGAINRAVAATRLGTSFNIVTGALNDAGPRNAGWDFNFGFGANPESPELAVFTFNTIAANHAEYLVDAGGHALVLHDGDVVGPGAAFSSAEAVLADPAWLAGTDGVVGVRFQCDGRLTYPVVGALCYGAIRIATTDTTGFPARIIESAFDGDGQPFAVVAPVPTNPPAATLTPASISLSVAANATRTQALTIANAVGSHPLQYAIAAQGESAALVPHPADLARFGSVPLALEQPLLPNRNTPSLLPVSRADVRGHAMAPWVAPGGIPFVLDDGSYETSIGLGQIAGVWLNRFTVLDALTLDSVSILWPQQTEGGSVVGLQANIVAYHDADGDGDPRNALRLGGDQLVTIGSLDTFETYPTSFAVPAAGDVYVGFVEHWAMNGYPTVLNAVAIDTDSLQGKSYLSINMPSEEAPHLDITELANNEFTGSLVALTGGFMGGNWLIRATGTGAACTGPAVPWLTATSVGNTVVGGASTQVIVKADPAAAALAPGSYTAELCITSNDPDQPVIALPVNLSVTAPTAMHACSRNGDGMFCDGFDGSATDDIVFSGRLNLPLPRTEQGLSFNFARAEWSQTAYFGDDFAPYWNPSAPFLMFYWHGDVMPGASGGVADTALGPYRVLRSGDTIGPASTFSAVANGAYGETANFLAGVDGYLGMKFFNEETGQTHYGYLHLITTWPSGYPATIVDYAYNRSGGPITIP